MAKTKFESRTGGKVYVAFIDYKKSIDTVDHDKLWDTTEEKKIEHHQNGQYFRSYVFFGTVMCKVGCEQLKFLCETRVSA